ncbi:uncharacterized protein LOC142566803 [Dermacentor variabilis]|uniref:uncharacterized protein LOC142566803 n=1 Tax=Dermacentor variabilis TaxID=34621 RepID=UPI003F5C1B74
MDSITPPERLHINGDGGKSWSFFKQKFEIFSQGTSCTEKPRSSAVKTAQFLCLAGEDALEVFNYSTFSAGESKEDYDTVVAKFESYCVDQQNDVHERYIFRTRLEAEGESFEQLLRDLKKQARYCNFGNMVDDMPITQVSKHKQSRHYCRNLPPLEESDVVRIRGSSWARKGQVIAPAGPWSYLVQADGSVLRRNRQHLLATRERLASCSSDDSNSAENQPPTN